MTIPPTAATTATDTNPTGTKKTEDALGRNAFLNLLVTQLQHQDPTQPQADGEFLAQLATFSQLEQLQQMNQKLDALETLLTGATTGA
ncbi:MAG: flagellar hook capping FlgD N-terminal domain-containing protein [Candidatus Binatia bacterium]